MDRPFVTAYSDILFTGTSSRELVESPHDIALGVDTDWREHYKPRTQHPPHDAEKVITANGRVQRVQRTIPYDAATGEFIGVAKFSVRGARPPARALSPAQARVLGKPYREARVFEKAYLIHLFQDMIEQGVAFGHADTPGRYREIDTQEDFDLARSAGGTNDCSPPRWSARCRGRRARGDQRSPGRRRRARRWTKRSAAVAMQEKAGLDVVTDGEWRRRSYIGVIAELAHGFTLEVNPRRRTAVDGRHREARAEAGRVHRARSAVPEEASHAWERRSRCPPPPCSANAYGTRERSRKAYPKREDFVRDCVAPLRREIELIRASGVDIVQIDDPHLCLFVDPDVRRSYDDPDRAADFAVDMTNAVVDGFRGIKFAVHLCRRAGRPRARRESTTPVPTDRSCRSSTGSRCSISRWNSPRRAPTTSKASAAFARTSSSASASSTLRRASSNRPR